MANRVAAKERRWNIPLLFLTNLGCPGGNNHAAAGVEGMGPPVLRNNRKTGSVGTDEGVG